MHRNVEKKDIFFYHALNRSLCRVARRIASRRRKLSGKDKNKEKGDCAREVTVKLLPFNILLMYVIDIWEKVTLIN